MRPCEQPHLQGRESKGAPLLLGRYVAHVAALGLALLFVRNASSGGLDIAAKILNRYFHLELGAALAAAGMVAESTGMGRRRMRAVWPMEIRFCVVQYRARAEAKL